MDAFASFSTDPSHFTAYELPHRGLSFKIYHTKLCHHYQIIIVILIIEIYIIIIPALKLWIQNWAE